GHVRGHVVHAGGGLQRDAAGVEGDALADQGHRARRCLGRVLETDQTGRAGRALTHADDAAVAALGELRLVETVTVTGRSATSSCARCAKDAGYRRFGGVLTRSRTMSTTSE